MAQQQKTITILTDKKPWTDTRPLDRGEVVSIDADLAAEFIKKGWAKEGRHTLED